MKPGRQSKSVWHRIVSCLFYAVNIVAGIVLLVCSYSGFINPVRVPLASVPGLVFPFALLAMLGVVALTFIFRWRIALAGVTFILIAMPAILDFTPFNLSKKVDSEKTSFSLLTYNCFGFKDQTDEFPGDVNPTLSYILNSGADIVCLQESRLLQPDRTLHITKTQIDSLHAIYPYEIITDNVQPILSKYPVEQINIGFNSSEKTGSADIYCFRTQIGGQTITIFNVHLQSFLLWPQDREMYDDVIRLRGSERELISMQRHLVNKVTEAAPKRVENTELLVRYIKKYGGPNVIVCGDFNDVPGCYSLRMLEREKLRQVYPEVGFGPMITYNSQKFYFRIDHVLCRGALKPVSMYKTDIKSSDHYPLKTTFEILDNQLLCP